MLFNIFLSKGNFLELFKRLFINWVVIFFEKLLVCIVWRILFILILLIVIVVFFELSFFWMNKFLICFVNELFCFMSFNVLFK